MADKVGSEGRRESTGGRLAEWGPLGVLVVFGVMAVAGYAVFGRDPTRLVGLSGPGLWLYGVSFKFFAQGHVLLAGVVVAFELWRRAGWRWLAAFIAVYLLSLGSELLGTAYGIPFGPYEYTSFLGVKWLGLVPALIPLSWFTMAVPSYGLASRWFGRAGGGAVVRIMIGSLVLLAWDLSLDPAMSEATPYWLWGERGPYYGMPLMNLFGWYVTGLVLMVVLERLGARDWLSGVSSRWLAAFYGANLLLPLGMAAAAGMWGAVLATAVVLGGLWAAALARSRRAERIDGGERSTGRRGSLPESKRAPGSSRPGARASSSRAEVSR
jgi:uncharacterized membrane protein